MHGNLLGKWLLVLLNSTFLQLKRLILISFGIHLVHQPACYITGVLSCIYMFFL